MASRATFQVAYDGEALREHYMDVHQLAPALLAFGDLVKEANREINGDDIKVNLLVSSDFEHKCFNIDFELLQTLYERAASFIKYERIQSAKELLEWLGLIGGPPAAGLIAYLRLRRGRRIESTTIIEQGDDAGKVAIKFEGDRNTIHVHQNVYDLGQNQRIRQSVVKVLAPLDAPGVESVEFRENGAPVERIDTTDADAIRQSCQTDVDEAIEPQIVTARLTLYSPVFDPTAKRWRFRYGESVIEADISETSIAIDAMKRGDISITDEYRVEMEITEEKTRRGTFVNRYKIKRILGFHQGPRQTSMVFPAPDDANDDLC